MEALIGFVVNLYRKNKEWRAPIISMAFSAALAFMGYGYFSFKHGEAMAAIGETKESVKATKEELADAIHRIDRNVEDLYGYVILKRLPRH